MSRVRYRGRQLSTLGVGDGPPFNVGLVDPRGQLLTRAGGGITFNWGNLTAPLGVTYARTGTIFLISNAASSTAASFLANAWATEVASDGVRELTVNGTYSNRITSPRNTAGAGWTLNAGVRDGAFATGPDGTAASGARVTLGANSAGSYASLTTGGAWNGTQTASCWIHNAIGSGVYCLALGVAIQSGNGHAITGTADTTWRPITITDSTNSKVFILQESRECTASGGTSPGARDTVTDLHQLVDLQYAPPFALTSAGATLVSVAGAKLISMSGRFDVDFATLKPYESAAARATDGYLLYGNATNHVRFRASDKKIVMTLGGAVVLATAALAYAANAPLAVRAWALGSGCGITVNGVTVTASAASVSVIPTTAFLLSDGTSAGVFPCRARGNFAA